MSITQRTDHVELGLSRLIEQYKEQPNITKLLEIILVQIQELEDAAWSVLVDRLLENATGKSLVTLGRIVGQPYRGNSDEEYKLFIKARIRVNRSNGHADDVIEVLRLLTPDTPFQYADIGMGDAIVTYSGIPFVDPGILKELAEEAAANATRIYIQVPTDTDTFSVRDMAEANNDSKGFGVGVNPEDLGAVLCWSVLNPLGFHVNAGGQVSAIKNWGSGLWSDQASPPFLTPNSLNMNGRNAMVNLGTGRIVGNETAVVNRFVNDAPTTVMAIVNSLGNGGTIFGAGHSGNGTDYRDHGILTFPGGANFSLAKGASSGSSSVGSVDVPAGPSVVCWTYDASRNVRLFLNGRDAWYIEGASSGGVTVPNQYSLFASPRNTFTQTLGFPAEISAVMVWSGVMSDDFIRYANRGLSLRMGITPVQTSTPVGGKFASIY